MCKSRTRYVNTWSYNFGALARVGLRVIVPCYIDRGGLYECNGAKNIVIGALQVKIINVHVRAHEHSPVYYIMHI